MVFFNRFSKILKKIFIIFSILIVLACGTLGFLSIQSGRGIGFIPKLSKELVKDLLFRSYGPKTIPAYKFVGLYTKMALQMLVEKKAPIYQEHILGYDISFANRDTFLSIYSEVFIKEVYHFFTTNKHPTIVDCGSNIGLTILYFKMLYPNAEIIGFEPSPHCFSLLKKNVANNNLTNITLHNKAVADKKGSCSFWDPSDGQGDGRASILVHNDPNHMATVETVLLSDYITIPIDLLKIDIEGSEFMVLQDLATTGKLKLIKEIVLEYHHHIPDNNIDRLGHFLSFLEDNNFGYQIRGCNIGIGYQFDAKQIQLLSLHAYNKNFSVISATNK